MVLLPDFRDLLASFGDAGVEYALVGGYAVAFHARPRATKDVDIVLAGDPPNLECAVRALSSFGAPPVVIAAVRTLGEEDVVYMGQPPARVDLLRTIEGVDPVGLFERRVRATFDGVERS